MQLFSPACRQQILGKAHGIQVQHIHLAHWERNSLVDAYSEQEPAAITAYSGASSQNILATPPPKKCIHCTIILLMIHDRLPRKI